MRRWFNRKAFGLLSGIVLAGAIAYLMTVVRTATPEKATPALRRVVSGQVVDAAGVPIAGAQVGTSFQLADTPDKTLLHISYAAPPVLTDAHGRFSMPAKPISYTKVVVAKKGDLLGFAVRNGAAPLQVRLAAPARLDVTLVKPFGSAQAVGVDLMKAGSAIGYGSIEGRARFAVPQGAYDLVLSQPEIVQTTKPLAFNGPESKPISVVLEPTTWAKMVGKPAPVFTPTDLRNAKDVSSAALHGKWVLVDFWATWCVPCVREMPRLISFYTTHAKDRNRFEIIAIHSPDGKSFAGIKTAYDALVGKAWDGKELPFPMIFDARGATQKRWGVEAYPTTLLIDPNGRLVGTATIDDLASKIVAQAKV